MTDQFIQIRPDSTGKKVDVTELTVAGETVQRERIQLAGGADVELADVRNASPLSTDYGLIVRPIKRNSNNTFGQLSIAASIQSTVVSFVAPAGWRFEGIIGGGESNGLFEVKFGAVTKYAVRTNIVDRKADFELPHPDASAGGTTVTVEVTNTGDQTGLFDVTLLGVGV